MNILITDAANPLKSSLVSKIVGQGDLSEAFDAVVRDGAKAARFTGKAGQLFETFVTRDGKTQRLALAGVGQAEDTEGRIAAAEKAGVAIAAKYLTSGETALTVDFADSGLNAEEAAALLLGLRLRSWRYDIYRTTMKDEQKRSLTDVGVANAPVGLWAIWEDRVAVAEGVELARELVTEPANVIYPESFVARVEKRFAGTGAKISFLTEAEMAELGMGALVGVSLGSERDARLLVIEWNGGAEGEAPMLFVGKGVTFDTGGISIKPAAGMEDMKWDMGGAAAVAGTMLTLAKRGAKANVVGVCGLVENMPDGKAQRPGDVVTTLSGQTVEVINTDAEGRLVLCDALTWAQRKFVPRAVVDLATLTGAIIISLGDEHGGMFANNDDLASQLDAAGKVTGDKLWRFPLSPAYDKLIDSPIADMKNVGARGAGSITAAQFLQRFIENDTPWAHLDIAGMVWANKAGGTWDKGATGYGVRLLDRYVRDNIEA